MKFFFILSLLFLFQFSYKSIRTNLKQRIALSYECNSVDGPESPHEVCMDFDGSKYSSCKGVLICKNNILARKETCYQLEPPNEAVEIQHETDVCDTNEFRNT